MGNLIRTRNKSQAPLTKYMGAFMPLRIFTALAIYCLANTVSKTALLETIINDWMKLNFTQSVEKEYYKKIAEKMNNRYEELKITQRSLTYSIFCEDLTKEFEGKGLYYGNIQSIIKEIDKLHFK